MQHLSSNKAAVPIPPTERFNDDASDHFSCLENAMTDLYVKEYAVADIPLEHIFTNMAQIKAIFENQQVV